MNKKAGQAGCSRRLPSGLQPDRRERASPEAPTGLLGVIATTTAASRRGRRRRLPSWATPALGGAESSLPQGAQLVDGYLANFGPPIRSDGVQPTLSAPAGAAAVRRKDPSRQRPACRALCRSKGPRRKDASLAPVGRASRIARRLQAKASPCLRAVDRFSPRRKDSPNRPPVPHRTSPCRRRLICRERCARASWRRRSLG
jgi:hypothetical protein